MTDGTDLLSAIRRRIAATTLADERATLDALVSLAELDGDARAAIAADAARLVRAVRGGPKPGIMESFLAEYGLTTKEGVARSAERRGGEEWFRKGRTRVAA